jgi:hypothetical protein
MPSCALVAFSTGAMMFDRLLGLSIMSELRLIDGIVEAFRNLGRRAHLRDVYQEVRRLGYAHGGKELNKHLRARIYEHSSDSAKFLPENPRGDLFRCLEKRSGVWELREDRSGVVGSSNNPTA